MGTCLEDSFDVEAHLGSPSDLRIGGFPRRELGLSPTAPKPGKGLGLGFRSLGAGGLHVPCAFFCDTAGITKEYLQP